MASKYIRSVTKILKATSGRLFGRVTSGTGHAEEITPADARTLLSVYSTSEVDAIIGGIDGLTSADIDTLSEINAILTDADLASISYVDSGLSGKQATLVSGTNVKTINSTSLLGSGDIAISASPAGSSGEVQYNNAGAFGGMVAVVYATTVTHVTITAQGATIVPLCVKGAASQSGNLFEVRSSANAKLIEITSAGELLQSTGDLLISGASAGTSGVAVRQNGFSYIRLQPNIGVLVSSSRQFGWTSNSFNISTSADTALSRNAAGTVEVNNGTAGTFRDLIVRNLRMASPTLVPASASATGSAGQIAWDADYIYVCTATNTWKRVAIATW